MIEFKGFPKIARLFRDCVITEKIDGTNGAIGIYPLLFGDDVTKDEVRAVGTITQDDVGTYAVYAQSRSKIITPKEDNHGFALWVWSNADALAEILGPGLHFGEWWGSGIQRGYGLPKGMKRFSLFNTKRWTVPIGNTCVSRAELVRVPGLHVVPVLYQGLFDTDKVIWVKDRLREHGSYAAPGFMRPEGVVIYHTAANVMFKSTLENDQVPKTAIIERGRQSELAAIETDKVWLRLAA